jgi:hypothetical protein
MRNIISKEEAEKILMKYYPRIVKSIYRGFEDYLEVANEQAIKGINVDFKPRTIASLIHDFIKFRIRDEFSDIDNAITREFNDVFGLYLDNKILIRFKKFNPGLTTSNIETKQTLGYYHQYSINGFPDKPTFLYAGYMPDKTWTSIKNIYIICRKGEDLEWIKDLTSTIEQTKIKFATNRDIELNKERAKIKKSIIKKRNIK